MEQEPTAVAQIQMTLGPNGNGATISFVMMNCLQISIAIPEEVIKDFVKARLEAKKQQQNIMEMVQRSKVIG